MSDYINLQLTNSSQEWIARAPLWIKRYFFLLFLNDKVFLLVLPSDICLLSTILLYYQVRDVLRGEEILDDEALNLAGKARLHLVL